MKRNFDSNNYRDYADNPKRKFVEDEVIAIEDEEGRKDPGQSADKLGDYIRDLTAEKHNLDKKQFWNTAKLVDEEISKVQSMGRLPAREYRFVNIYRDKPIKVTTKVLVPVLEHPKFNFVGKLLGPKGNSLKRLQEETMCKMSILGRGSMKDPQKEGELKESGDPKYAHLSDDLHVEISAFGPPAEAHARMAFALAEVRKYLIPDKNDSIRQEQLRELEVMSGSGSGAPPSSFRNPRMMKGPPNGTPHQFGNARPPPLMRTASRAPAHHSAPRVMPAKIKIMSILDRARLAMEESYDYNEPINTPGPHQAYRSYEAQQSPAYDYSGPDYYRKNPPARYGRHPAY